MADSHLKYPCYVVKSEAFVVVKINRAVIFCGVKTRSKNPFVIKSVVIVCSVVCLDSSCVVAVGVAERVVVRGVKRLAFAIKLMQLLVLAVFRFAAMLVDSHAPYHTVIVS